jgi:hypothetical protein
VLTGEPRHQNLELSCEHNKARHSRLTRLEQDLSGPNCSRSAERPDAVDLVGCQDREGLGLPVG